MGRHRCYRSCSCSHSYNRSQRRLKRKPPDPLVTLTELRVTLIENYGNQNSQTSHQGMLSVKYPMNHPNNKIFSAKMYSYLEFKPTYISVGVKKYPIIDGEASLKYITDDIYQIEYPIASKNVTFKYVYSGRPISPGNPDLTIIKLKHAISAKPMPNNFVANIAIGRLYEIIYGRKFRCLTENERRPHKSPGYGILPVRPIHQMVILAMQSSNSKTVLESMRVKNFQEWWNKNRIDPLTYPRPSVMQLHKWLKNPEIIYSYYD